MSWKLNLFSIIVIIHALCGFNFILKHERGDYTQYIPVYTGKISEKLTQEQPCGKHKRHTCTQYIFVIDTMTFEVSENQYIQYTIGQFFTQTVNYEHTPWYAIYFILALIPLLVISPIMVGVILAQNTLEREKNEKV